MNSTQNHNTINKLRQNLISGKLALPVKIRQDEEL